MAQSDLIDVGKDVFHIHVKRPVRIKGKSVYFSILPSEGPGGNAGNLLITSTTAAFYAGDKNTSFLSNMTFEPYLALGDRIGLAIRSNVWSNDNKWDILGDKRFLYYPQYTWGLGGNPNNNNRLLIDYKYVRLYETFLKRIKPYLFAGFGYLLDDHYDMDTQGDSSALEKFTHYHYGTGSSENSLSSGLSVNLLYDSRKNSVNPLPGFYAQFVYRFNPVFLGSNNDWHSWYFDVRKYIPFSHVHQNMLAFWTFFWRTGNKYTPYLDLPSVGWDPYQQRSGRGFEQNRYRGKGLAYMESEYRRDITHNGILGFVLFANVNSVTEPVTHQYAYLHPAGGGGLRIKFNKHSNTNVALDYGVSKGYSGLYLNLGETF